MREEMRGGVWKGRERGERRMERREKLLRERDRGWGRGWRGRLPCLELQKMYMYTYIVHVHVCNILVLHKYAVFSLSETRVGWRGEGCEDIPG